MIYRIVKDKEIIATIESNLSEDETRGLIYEWWEELFGLTLQDYLIKHTKDVWVIFCGEIWL